MEDGQVTINYVSAEDAEILVALYEDRTDALKLITTVTVEVSAEANTATATLPEEVPEYFIVGAYLIRSGSHEPLCEEYTSSYYTQAMQEFMSAPLTDFAEEAEDRMVILDQGTEEDGSDADFLIFREGTVILRETEEQNHIAKNEDGSYTITGADASALALQGGDKIGYKKLDASLDVFLVESVISQSGDTVVFTESLEIDMETFFDTIRIEEAPPSDAVEYDTSDIAPGFTYRGEGDLSEEVAPFYEAAEHLEDGEALPESLGDVVVMGGPPGTVPAEIEGSIGLDIDVDYEDVRKWIGHPLPDNGDQEEGTFSAQPDFKAEGSFSVGLKLEMQIFLTKEYQYISVNISLSQILMLKLQGGAKVSFLIGKFVVPTPISGLTFAGEVRLIFNFKVELSFVASWTSTLGFEYDSFRVYAPFRNTSSSSDTKPKTALSLKGTLEFGVKVSLKTEFISENVGKLELWGKDVITLKAETELSILRRLNQGIDSWKDLLFDGYTELDPSNSSVSEIHACDNCIAGTATKSYSVGLDLTMIKIIQGSAHADLVSCPPSDFYYSVDSREFGWTRCPHRLYKLSLTLVDGLDYTLGDVVLNWYDQDSVEAENAARHAIEGAVVTVVSKDGNYVQDRELITGKDGKVWIFLPAGNYTVRAYSDTYFGVQDFKIYDSAREYCMILEEMQGESHTEGNITWTFYPNGVLCISGTGDIADYDTGNAPWTKHRDEVNTVLIQNGITGIGDHSFSEFENVKQVQLPGSLERIGLSAFDGCSALKVITIPSGVTQIENKAFFHCGALKKAYYNGSQGQWEKGVTIGSKNEDLTDHLIFNSAVLANGQCGDALFWSLSTGGALTISGTGPMTSYASAADVPWNKYRDKIDTLLIEQGVTTLSPYAFSACAILEVAIPNSVTSLGVSCFAECPRLIRVTLPESISQIPERCFHACTEMKRINIPGHVTSIGQSAFFSCNSLKEANYMGTRWEWDKNVSVAIENGPLLQALKTLDEDMKSIGKCGDDMEAFISEGGGMKHLIIQGSGEMTSRPWADQAAGIAVVHFSGNIETLVSSAFADTALQSITIPDSVRAIGNFAFYNCKDLQTVDLPAGLQSIGEGAFSGCSSLQISSLPEGLESIGSRAFMNCTSITSLTVPNSVVSMGDLIFRYCNNLKNLTLPFLGNTRNDAFACGFSRFFADNSDYTCSALETVTVTDAYNIQEKAFKYEANAYAARFPNLRSIRISGPATSVGKEAFYGLGALETCVLPDTVTSIGNSAFYNCAKVSLTLPAGLESIGDSAFYGCAALDAPMPAGLKSIGYSAFSGCRSLQISSLPEGLESIGSRAFTDCTSITSLTVPNSVVSMGDLIFRYCNNLKNLTLPFLGNTRNDAFACGFSRFFADNSDYTCSALETVTVTDAYNIQEKAFKYEANAYAARFPNLRSIRISGPATSVGKEAFYGLGALETCTLPGSVSSIGNSAFYKCSKLAELSFDGTMEEWQAIAIGSGNTPLYGIPIHCSDGDLIMDPAAALEAPEEPEDAEAPLEKGEAEGGSIGLLEPTEEADPVIEPAPTEDPDPVIEPAPTEEPDPVIEPAPTKEPGNVGLASFSGEETGEAGAETIYTASFGGLMPGEEYLILAVRSDEESVLLENDNILFVGQQEANEDGALSIHYIKKSDEPALLRCYGMSDKCFTASDKLDVVISQGATDSQAFALAVSYDGVELEEARDYLVSFDYLEDDVVQITLKGIVDYSGSTVIQAKASCTGEDNIDGYAVIHMAHQWGEPVWTWSEDWTHAEAAFSCTRDEAHTITRECEVSMTTENNVTTWTAAVSLGGKQYTETHKIWHGDLNRDEKVDALDLMMMRNLLLELNQEGLDRADVNGDGTVSILDLVRLRKHLAGEEVILH